MKISNVKVDLFNWTAEPWKTGVGTAFGQTKQLGVVSVETDEGVSGNAFLGSSRVGADHYAPGLIEFAKPLVMERDPQDIGAIWWDLWKQNRSISTNVIGAIDICLWDINGKIAGQPIHRLLGTCKHKVPVYSSTAWHATIEAYVEEALRFKHKGWSAHKIHPHGEPKADIAISMAVREAVGDEMKLMLDSMWAYQYEDALRVGRAIEELDFYWYEDPLVEEDIYSYVKLRQKLDVPIMSTEYAPGRYLRHDPVDHGICHRYPAWRCCGHRRHHADGAPLQHGRGLRHEMRDPPRRQLAEQCREPARDHGRAELRVLRVLSMHRRERVRPGRGHSARRRLGLCADRAGARLRD